MEILKMEPGTRDPRILASFVPWCRKRSDVFKRLKYGVLNIFDVLDTSHWKLTKNNFIKAKN